jgi:hypothetical protein
MVFPITPLPTMMGMYSSPRVLLSGNEVNDTTNSDNKSSVVAREKFGTLGGMKKYVHLMYIYHFTTCLHIFCVMTLGVIYGFESYVM